MQAVGKWTVATLVWAAMGIGYLNVMIVPPLILGFVTELGLSYTDAAFLMTAFAIGVTAGGVPAGYIGTRMGGLTGVGIGLALISISQLAISFNPPFALMVILRGFVGFGTANIWVSGVIAMRSWFPKERLGTALGGMNASIAVGVSFALGITPVLGRDFGLLFPFQISGLAGLILATSIAVLRGRTADRKETPSSTGSSNTRRPAYSTVGVGLLGTISFALLFQVFLLVTWIPPYLEGALFFDVEEVGLTSSILPLSAIPASILGAYLVDRTGRVHGLINLGILWSFSALLLIGPFTTLALMILIIGIVTLGVNMAIGPFYMIISRVSSPSATGKVTGIISTSGFSSSIVASFLGGYLLDSFNSYAPIFSLVIVTSTAALIASGLLRRYMIN